MEVPADDRRADVERLDQHVLDEFLRGSVRRARRRNSSTTSAVEPQSPAARAPSRRTGSGGRRPAAGEIIGRVRLEGQRRLGDVRPPRDLVRADHLAMAEMHSVEIADRVDRAASAGGGRTGSNTSVKAGSGAASVKIGSISGGAKPAPPLRPRSRRGGPRRGRPVRAPTAGRRRRRRNRRSLRTIGVSSSRGLLPYGASIRIAAIGRVFSSANRLCSASSSTAKSSSCSASP